MSQKYVTAPLLSRLCKVLTLLSRDCEAAVMNRRSFL
jgi:hypothetical protein